MAAMSKYVHESKLLGANLNFSKPDIRAIVTTVGGKTISFMDSASSMGLSEKEALRLAKTLSLNKRHVVSGDQTTTDLCFDSATNILEEKKNKS
jgi:hypothetical protein